MTRSAASGNLRPRLDGVTWLVGTAGAADGGNSISEEATCLLLGVAGLADDVLAITRGQMLGNISENIATFPSPQLTPRSKTCSKTRILSPSTAEWYNQYRISARRAIMSAFMSVMLATWNLEAGGSGLNGIAEDVIEMADGALASSSRQMSGNNSANIAPFPCPQETPRSKLRSTTKT